MTATLMSFDEAMATFGLEDSSPLTRKVIRDWAVVASTQLNLRPSIPPNLIVIAGLLARSFRAIASKPNSIPACSPAPVSDWPSPVTISGSTSTSRWSPTCGTRARASWSVR